MQHEYDVVIGSVADDNTMETVQLYLTGILSVEEAVSRLRYNKVNNQVLFHTEKALNYLKKLGENLMNDVIYVFHGKDITRNICIQIWAVVDVLQERLNIDFIEAIDGEEGF